MSDLWAVVIGVPIGYLLGRALLRIVGAVVEAIQKAEGR